MPGGGRRKKKNNSNAPQDQEENESPDEKEPSTPPNTNPPFKFDFGAPSKEGAFGRPVFDFSNPVNKELLNAVTTQMGNLVGKSSGYFESLPKPVRNRIRALKTLHKTKVEIDAQYKKAKDELEKKFEEKYAPLFTKRSAFVVGSQEPTEEELGSEEENEPIQIEEVKDEKDKEKQKSEDAPKGIPDFWLTAMKHHDTLQELITEKDAEALHFLTDIKVRVFQDVQPKKEEVPEPKAEEDEVEGPLHGFVLEFYFTPNPFFSDSLLSKTYFLSMSLNEEIYHHAEATEIKWNEGKNLTIKKVTRQEKPKKNRNKRTGKGQPMKTVTIEEPQESFFNFFSPEGVLAAIPLDEEDEEEEATLLEEDYQCGLEIKEALIPNAVLYFTGEVASYGDFSYDEEDEEGDEEGEDEDFTPNPNEKAAECKQQ